MASQKFKFTPATISIGRPKTGQDSDEKQIIRIQIKVNGKRQTFELSVEDFTLAITGMADVPAALVERITLLKDDPLSVDRDDSSLAEILVLADKATQIRDSSLPWRKKHDLIFSREISGRVFDLVQLDYRDPDTTHEEDVKAFTASLRRRAGLEDFVHTPQFVDFDRLE
jgi:hypothetical protein